MTWASHILSEPQLLHLHNGPNSVPEPFGKAFRYRFRRFLEKRDLEDLDKTFSGLCQRGHLRQQDRCTVEA